MRTLGILNLEPNDLDLTSDPQESSWTSDERNYTPTTPVDWNLSYQIDFLKRLDWKNQKSSFAKNKRESALIQ